MSWVVEEWKEGLSTRVLNKIQELESQVEKLKKERQQKQFQLESLEAALQKQKQKVENEKNEGVTLKRETQSLMEQCDHLEKTRQKLAHELQLKESQVNFQEGQLVSSNKQIERLEQELKRYKSELEQSQQALVGEDSSFSGTPQKNVTAPSVLSQNDSKFEELQEKYSKETEERKRLEAELKNMKSQKTNPLHPQSMMSRREIARQQASSSVFSWQQEKTPSRPLPNNQETPISSGLVTSLFPWEVEATSSHKDLKLTKKQSGMLGCYKDSPLLDEMKKQNQELRSRIQELEHSLQIQTYEMKCHVTKLQEVQLQLENTKTELKERDKALNNSRNEITKVSAQLDQATGQLTIAEEKMKKLSEELSCQRQNSESTRCALEQKMKEKEKEYQEELSFELNQVKMKLQEELHQSKNNYNLLQAEFEKTRLAKQQLEKTTNDFTQNLTRADQALKTIQLKENELRKNYEEVKKQSDLLSCQATQQSQEIYQLKEELCMAKQLLQKSQSFAEEIKNKNYSLERELRLLEEKLEKQEPLTVGEMKCTISDLESQRDSLRQLLKHKENTIEELSIKLDHLATLQNALSECEGLKKEIQILAHWKKENEQVLNELGSEKEGLISKIDCLERALMTEQIKSNERVRAVEAENKNLQSTLEAKTTELEAQKVAFYELQQQTETSEEKYRKERENNSLKLSEFTKQVDVLQQALQSATNEVLEKQKCISSLETSLASHMQLNAHFQKQLEELIQTRDEMERKLCKAEQWHEGFVKDAEQQISSLQVAVSEKQASVTKALAALREKDEELQVLIKESERQQGEIKDLKINNAFLEVSIHQLKVAPQVINHEGPDLSAEISLNKKEVARLEDENSILKSDINMLEQKILDLMQTNLHLSSTLKEREETLSELSERHQEVKLLLSEVEGKLRRKFRSLETKNDNLESALREQASHFEVEKAELEYQEKLLVNEREQLQRKLISLEEKNKILLGHLEKKQLVSEETESSSIQNVLSVELDILRQEMAEQSKYNTDNILLPKTEQLVKEIKIRNVDTSNLTLDKTTLEQLRSSVKEKEEELNKYQVKLELLQMDLEDKEVSIENYTDQVKQLETVLQTMEIKMEESEKEKARLIHELQAGKDLENSTSEITEWDENDQSPTHFNAVTKDNFNQQINAKHLSVPHDLMPSQNDYVRLVSSLHMTMSKLNELEKMCEHLQIEKSTLASQLKGSQLEFITSTDTMAEELMNKINMVKEERAAELMDQTEPEMQSDIERISFIALECCVGLGNEDLKLSNEEIKIHFDRVKEKIVSLKNEHQILHEQNLGMVSKISELQCCIETLKEENTALSTSLNQVNTASFMTQVTSSHMDKEFQSDGKFSMWFPCCGETPHCTKPICRTSDFDSNQNRPSKKTTDLNSSNKQTDLESTPDELHSDDAWVFVIKQGRVAPKKYHLTNKIEQQLLCETYEKSFRMLEESFESPKTLEDDELQKIQELLLSARKEVDFLQKQNMSDSKQWKQKLCNVILRVASKSSAEKKPAEPDLEEPRLHLQGLDLSSQLPLYIDTEHQVPISADQASDPLCQLEMYSWSSENKTLEHLNDEVKARTHEANGTEDKRLDYETVIGIKSSEKCLQVLLTESRNAWDQSTSPSECPEQLPSSALHELMAMPSGFLENHSTVEMPQLQIKETYEHSKPSHDAEESNNNTETLLMEIQNLNTRLESKDKELTAKTIAFAGLDKTVLEFEKEKKDFSEALKSVMFDNEQLSYNIVTLEIEFEKVKSDLEMYKIRLSDTTDALENLEMAKADWTEQLLEMENELRRTKLERENVEKHALSMEADIEELQSKNKQLEKENENKRKTIFGLQDQLCIISAERSQLSQDLAALSNDKEKCDQMCQNMQQTIKELELSKVDSAEFIRILEAEAKTQTKLLEAVNTDTERLSKEKEGLAQQLQILEKFAGDLVLEKEAVQSQIELLSKEKEGSLRECETLRSKLSVSEMEISRISKSLEGSLIEKGELAARLNSAQEAVSQMRQGIEKLKIKIESDEKKRGHLAEKLKESKRKTDALVDKMESLERELQMSEENLEGAIIQAEAAKAEEEIVTTEMEETRVNLQHLELEMDGLKSEKEHLERELREKQEQVSNLEGSNSSLVKRLEEREKEEVQMKCSYGNTLLSLQSQLKQACDEVKLAHKEQEIWKAKEEEMLNAVTSLQQENINLVQQQQEAEYRHSQAEQLMEALVEELQDIKQCLDEHESFLKQLPKNKTLHTILEDPQVFSKHPVEKLETTAPEKQTGSLKQIMQLTKELDSFNHTLWQWMKSSGEIRQEKELMEKRIQELETRLKMAGSGSPKDVTTEELRLQLEEMKESVKGKTTEADQNLEKYCALIINHYKLEEENEMLKTQVSLLNAQLKRLLNASSSVWQSPGNPVEITDGLLIERSFSDNSAKITTKNQRCQENRRCGKEARSALPEAISNSTKQKSLFPQHSPTLLQNPTGCKSDASPKMEKKGSAEVPPGNSDPRISCRTNLTPQPSPKANLKSSSTDIQIVDPDYFSENPKSTAEGSKVQKMNDAELQEIHGRNLLLGSPRSPLSVCNPFIQAASGRSAECLDTTEAVCSPSGEGNELDTACRVQ